MTIDDLLAVKGVSDPQLSPDGKQVVYVVSEIDRAANKTNSALWLVPVEGGSPKPLTTTPGTNTHPRWSPDGKTIAFVSSRSGTSQIWLLPIDGGEPRQLTKLPIDVAGPIWSPKGDTLAFAARVYPGKTPEETAQRDKEKAEDKSHVQTYDKLMVRHWTDWDDGKRSHLFVCDATTGAAKDLTPKLEVNTPPAPFGDSADYAFSPDGKELAFTVEPIADRAWSTNTDIWTVPASGGEMKNLTEKNKGADAQPAYSPDGRCLAYLNQARAGFEADQWVLRLQPRGSYAENPETPLTAKWDRSVHAFTWAKYGLFAVLDDNGTEPIVQTGAYAWADGPFLFPGPPAPPLYRVTGGVNGSVQVAGDGRTLVFVRHDAAHPAEVFKATVDVHKANPEGAAPIQLTHHNDALIASLDLPKAESFTFKGADGDTVQGWLFKPPGFDASKKYPVVFLIHGGPQGAWHDEWHNRWNYPMFTAPGYVAVAINPRGSTGFGQSFTDQISGDWSGRVYDDLMLGLDHALKTYPFLDGDRVAALGGSYGGYMVNWICGHSKRFKALISHAGVFDLASMYATTEELWFPEWEFGGPPVGEARALPRSFPEHLRRAFPDAYTRHPWCARFPGARGAGAGDVHDVATAGRGQPLRVIPRRGPLDRQAGQPRGLVAGSPSVARPVPPAPGLTLCQGPRQDVAARFSISAVRVACEVRSSRDRSPCTRAVRPAACSISAIRATSPARCISAMLWACRSSPP